MSELPKNSEKQQKAVVQPPLVRRCGATTPCTEPAAYQHKEKPHALCHACYVQWITFHKPKYQESERQNWTPIPSPPCPDCGGGMHRNNETDGWWFCGKCDEAKCSVPTHPTNETSAGTDASAK